MGHESTPVKVADPDEYVEPFARVVAANLTTQFPYAAHHVQADEHDVEQPGARHPAFANSYDWHSSVHMHWLGTQLVDAHTSATDHTTQEKPEGLERIAHLVRQNLTPTRLTAEAAYLTRNPGWERPYGWAWAAQLVDALRQSRTPEINELAPGAEPLLTGIMDLLRAWLPKMREPVRHGVHSNTAFALRRLLLVARRNGMADVAELIGEHARRFYARDAAWPFGYERSGHDFLSPGFCEADLMIEVLSPQELASWLPDFLTELAHDAGAGRRPKVLKPGAPGDTKDGQQTHLDGLGLTVAASGMRVAEALDQVEVEPALAATLRAAAPELMHAGVAAATSDEFMASHWLATFAWEALEEAHPR